VLTGTPIREELLNGSKILGLRFCGFSGNKPVLMIMGGSLGARAINEAIRKGIDKLLINYDIIHICGKGNIDEKLKVKEGYKQFEYVNEELPNLMAAADLVVSRAGANSIFEFLVLRKPTILIPLSAKASRGDQILNAASFEKAGYSLVIQDDELTEEVLISKLQLLEKDKEKFIKAMKDSKAGNGVNSIIELIRQISTKCLK